MNSKLFSSKNLLVGFGVGIILAIANWTPYGLPTGLVYIKMFPFLDRLFILIFFQNCSGEGCLGPMIIIGSIMTLTITPILLIFARYVFDVKNYPYSRKKIAFVVLISMLLSAQSGIFYGVAYLESEAREYSRIERTQSKNYSSLNECSKVPTEIGQCYGYFASKENDIKLCYEYLKNVPGSYTNWNSPKDEILAVCISSFAKYKNDVNFCNQINQTVRYLDRCKKEYYIAKNDTGGCLKIENNFFRKNCLEETHNPLFHLFISKYARLRGFMN